MAQSDPSDREALAGLVERVTYQKRFCVVRINRAFGTLFGTSHGFHPTALVVHCRWYIPSAAASARVHPARLPCASSRLARAKVAANMITVRITLTLWTV